MPIWLVMRGISAEGLEQGSASMIVAFLGFLDCDA